MDKVNKDDSRFIVVGIFIIGGLILLILVVAFINKDMEKSSINSANISLDKTVDVIGNKNNIYQDKICNLSFKIPNNWQKSLTKLPLPQEPLVQTVFDEGGKKSVFSYICYDDKYSFDQFNNNSDLKPEQIKVNNIDFTRVGNFVYFNRGDKLIIFQMFFTKNDIEPVAGYEEKLLAILQSIL